MTSHRLWILAGTWVCLGSLVANAATTRKPGLWEISTTTSWQKSPTLPGINGQRLPDGTHIQQVCLTPEMIEKGALLPQSRGKCTVENAVLSPGKMTGEYVCTGAMMGKGSIDSVWSDDEHTAGTVHFLGTMQIGHDVEPVEWTTQSKATFKSSSCGSVAPQAQPQKAQSQKALPQQHLPHHP